MDAKKQMHYIQSLLDKRVDGVVMNSVGSLDRAQQEFLSSGGVPVVLLNRPRSESNFSSVTPDNADGEDFARAGTCCAWATAVSRTSRVLGENVNLRDRSRGFLRSLAGQIRRWNR